MYQHKRFYHESNDDDVMGPVDVIRTFDRTELTKDICDTISKCFSNMTEAHALIWDAFIEASELVHVLAKRGMALLLEAMVTGSIVVQDTKTFNILQEAKVHQRICEEIKAQESKMHTYIHINLFIVYVSDFIICF